MLHYFGPAREAIIQALKETTEERHERYNLVSQRWGQDSLERLVEFTSRGKMIRGCLVRLGFELASQRKANSEEEQVIARAGAAMELFQSGLLIHDDIMDRDRLRRGKPTLHVSYAAALDSTGFEEPDHNGISLGICAGDLAYFLAFELLGGLDIDAELRSSLQTLAAQELGLVGLAQMQDVCNGAHGANANLSEPDEAAILEVFRYKTGRYTFSLPLSMGARIAGMPIQQCLDLERAGEFLGMLFQIKDDELGIFANPKVLGKPVGADIRENKKTLYRYRLLQRLPQAQAVIIQSYFGKSELSNVELEMLRNLIEDLGVRQEIKELMENYANKTRELLLEISTKASSEASLALNDLIDYSLKRES